MKCPEDVAEVLLGIIEQGILRIRALAWAGRVEQCAVEADHLHNLPGLLDDFSRERLAYYWEVERVSYLTQIHEGHDVMEPLWDRLRPQVENHQVPASRQ